MELAGRAAIVTGGSNGIGREVVERLLEAGARVGVLDLVAPAPYRCGQAIHLPCDVSDWDQVERAVGELWDSLGTFDVLVNNAGVVEDQPLISFLGAFRKHDRGAWDRVIAGTLSSVFYVTVQVAERMVRARALGVIVNIGSVAAQGNAGQSAYSAAKAGVAALSKTWARELNPLGIRVVCVAPGFTQTAIVERMPPKQVEGWKKRIPLRRMAQPAEIADGVMFVIRNDYFNGKVLELDGGLLT
jgi:3-oxoacyl-[acyl-carrier protein] reductase